CLVAEARATSLQPRIERRTNQDAAARLVVNAGSPRVISLGFVGPHGRRNIEHTWPAIVTNHRQPRIVVRPVQAILQNSQAAPGIGIGIGHDLGWIEVERHNLEQTLRTSNARRTGVSTRLDLDDRRDEVGIDLIIDGPALDSQFPVLYTRREK